MRNTFKNIFSQHRKSRLVTTRSSVSSSALFRRPDERANSAFTDKGVKEEKDDEAEVYNAYNPKFTSSDDSDSSD